MMTGFRSNDHMRNHTPHFGEAEPWREDLSNDSFSSHRLITVTPKYILAYSVTLVHTIRLHTYPCASLQAKGGCVTGCGGTWHEAT